MPDTTTQEVSTATVEAWLLNNGEAVRNDRFLSSLRQWLQTHEHLTERQHEAAERNYRTVVLGEVGGNAAYPDEATFDQVSHIHNGVYTIDNGTEHHTFQIYTPIRGPLAGKRIIKRSTGYGFKGFAFLTSEGGVRVWQRFTEDEERGSLYIVWAKALIAHLNENELEGTAMAETTSTSWADDNDVNWRVSYSTMCRRCNRRLTTPTSVAAGLGPECASRSVEETVAADPQTMVDSAANEATLARQRAEAQLRREQEEARRAEQIQMRLDNLPRSVHDPEMVL